MAKVKQEEATPTKRRPKSRIPTFKTVEEEAAFWDTHSSADYEDELEVVTDVKFVRVRPKKAITVRLEEDAMAALRKQARAKGIGPSALARLWILEHLTAESEQRQDDIPHQSYVDRV